MTHAATQAEVEQLLKRWEGYGDIEKTTQAMAERINKLVEALEQIVNAKGESWKDVAMYECHIAEEALDDYRGGEAK